MFHPDGVPLERGWVGRVGEGRVVHLAAQTLQHFFSGGARAREHAEYALSEVTLLAPVTSPPAVRVFESERSFAFANPAAVVGPDAVVARPDTAGKLTVHPRLAAMIGAGGRVGGITLLAEWRAPGLEPPKDRDFALGLGPFVVTPDEPEPGPITVRVAGRDLLRAEPQSVDWASLCLYAARGTELRTGDLIAAPAAGVVGEIGPGALVEIAAEPIGILTATVR